MTNVPDTQTNGITLLPCPFCGGEAEIHPSNDWDVKFTGATYFAWCDKCETRSDYYATEAEAIEAWNTRSITAAAVMGYEAALSERTCEVVTSELAGQMWVYRHEFSCDCGQRNLFTTSSEPPRFCPNCGAKVVDDA